MLNPRRLTWNLQSPPMSSVLSKQTGSKPSSRQHLIDVSPLTPAPITAILLWVMVSGALRRAGSPRICPEEWMTKDRKHTAVNTFQEKTLAQGIPTKLAATGVSGGSQSLRSSRLRRWERRLAGPGSPAPPSGGRARRAQLSHAASLPFLLHRADASAAIRRLHCTFHRFHRNIKQLSTNNSNSQLGGAAPHRPFQPAPRAVSRPCSLSRVGVAGGRRDAGNETRAEPASGR